MTRTSKVFFSSLASLMLGGIYYASQIQGDHVPLDAQRTEFSEQETQIVRNPEPTPNEFPVSTPDTVISNKKTSKPRNYSPWKDENSGWRTKPIEEVIPEYKGKEDFIRWAEKLREEDPVSYRYLYDNPFKKEIGLEEAKGKLDVLMDHTMIIASTCGNGTGWILDYVLPEDGKYPTKFFIVSDAHVVGNFQWDKDNPYKQELSYSGGDCEVSLVKEAINHEEKDFDRANWPDQNRATQWSDMIFAKHKDLSKPNGPKYWWQSDNILQFTFTKPKLVYFPYNYLGEDKSKWTGLSTNYDYHFADFAILEVDFGTEDIAKKFTRNFYEKYDREKGTHRDKALKLFADPLNKKYTNQQLLEEDVQIWMAGYPSDGWTKKASSNYNINRKSASRLKYYCSGSIRTDQGNECERDNNGKAIRECESWLGLTDISYWYQNEQLVEKWYWGNKVSNVMGSLYVIDNVEVHKGASGSVAATGDGEVLGVYVLNQKSKNSGMILPIRSTEIRDKDGKVIVPAHDFLEGVEGQKGSYKESIQKYVLKNGAQTNLSRFRGWQPVVEQ